MNHDNCVKEAIDLERKLRAAEDRARHYRYAAIRLAGFDKEKLRAAMLAAEYDFKS